MGVNFLMRGKIQQGKTSFSEKQNKKCIISNLSLIKTKISKQDIIAC